MPHLPHSEHDELTDEEPTNPPRAMQFRCSLCELELTLPESSERAPKCVDCKRYMAPVNPPTARGQA